jgi:hypothetical protein
MFLSDYMSIIKSLEKCSSEQLLEFIDIMNKVYADQSGDSFPEIYYGGDWLKDAGDWIGDAAKKTG